MSPCHCQCQPDQNTVLQNKIHAYNAKMEPIYKSFFAGADCGGNTLSSCKHEILIVP